MVDQKHHDVFLIDMGIAGTVGEIPWKDCVFTDPDNFNCTYNLPKWMAKDPDHARCSQDCDAFSLCFVE